MGEMKPSILNIDEIHSYWYTNIIEEWNPEKEYIEYLKKKIEQKEYLPPIIVVKADKEYTIVNGHHRYYAQLCMGVKRIKVFVLNGTFKDTEPLRKAEVLLKKYDKNTKNEFQFSGYLDRWAAAAENHVFINKYRPIYRIDIYSGFKRFVKDIYCKLFKKKII